MPNKKEKEKLPCPSCGNPLDVRAFKNHVINKHDFTRSQADEAFRQASGREATSWKQMSRNRSQAIHPSATRSDLPPMDTTDLAPSEPSDRKAWFQEGFEMGWKLAKESKQ